MWGREKAEQGRCLSEKRTIPQKCVGKVVSFAAFCVSFSIFKGLRQKRTLTGLVGNIDQGQERENFKLQRRGWRRVCLRIILPIPMSLLSMIW